MIFLLSGFILIAMGLSNISSVEGLDCVQLNSCGFQGG